MSDNASQFESQFFRRVFQVMGIENAFTSTYHPQTNGQTERYNRSILAVLGCYVMDHQRDCYEYVQVLT